MCQLHWKTYLHEIILIGTAVAKIITVVIFTVQTEKRFIPLSSGLVQGLQEGGRRGEDQAGQVHQAGQLYEHK